MYNKPKPLALHMTEITAAFGQLTTLFAVFVTLAITVVGFMKGRSWLRKA